MEIVLIQRELLLLLTANPFLGKFCQNSRWWIQDAIEEKIEREEKTCGKWSEGVCRCTFEPFGLIRAIGGECSAVSGTLNPVAQGSSRDCEEEKEVRDEIARLWFSKIKQPRGGMKNG